MSNPLIVVMGVSGSGKSAIGSALGAALNIPFYDADDYHPKSNIEKMSSSIPLTDEDREPWLKILKDLLLRENQLRGCVLACSALKNRYRDELMVKKSTQFVFLNVDIDTVRKRQLEREGHFMPVSLLESQFDALESPVDVLVVKNKGTIEETVNEILGQLKITPQSDQ